MGIRRKREYARPARLGRSVLVAGATPSVAAGSEKLAGVPVGARA
jgi:hypothetical protein